MLTNASVQYQIMNRLAEETMAKVQISARVDEALKNALERYCKSRGVVMNHFIQEALLDRLEELEDVEELKQIRHETTRPLAEVLKELKLNGRL